MKLVAALGNIGDKYVLTRHNIGFMFGDLLAEKLGMSFKLESKLKSLVAKSADVLIFKPTTFMNLSGEAVSLVMNYYKIDVKDLIVVYDDLSIELGRIRFRPSGSDGGHNGIKSLIAHVGGNKFDRLKLGIGPQPNIPSEAFVLQNFSKEQLPILKETLETAVEAVQFYIENDLQKAQNKFNN